MKIVILGHSNVGKTTYMASLYFAMQEGYEGFTLRAASADDARYLAELGQQITVGTYPAPTAKRSEYHLVLQYRGRDVVDFHWADYSGGAIDRTTKDDQKALLLQDLSQADGVMMLCDCSEMTPNWVGGNSPIGRHVAKMSNMFQYAVPRLTHPISLAILLTKVDLVRSFKEKMLDPLDGVISAVEVSPMVRAALIPTACGNTFINVPMPLLFALDAAVEHKNRSLLQSLSWTESAAAREQEASQGIGGFFDKVHGWWTGQPTHGDKAAAERSKAAMIRTEQKAIQESLAAISRQTKQLQLVRRKTGTYEYVSRVAEMVDKPAHRRGFLNLG